MKKNNWSWVPSLYFAEGLPYIVVISVSVIMYKNLNLSNSEIAFYTSWLYLPWVIKPFWAPLVDAISTKRIWIILTQLALGFGFAVVALTLPTDGFVKYTLAGFWLIAFASATHDVAADGFYMLALSENEQSFFVGIRSTFYRLAMLSGQGLLVILAGALINIFDSVKTAWIISFGTLAVVFVFLFLYHKFILPEPATDSAKKNKNPKYIWINFLESFKSFFKKDKILLSILFILFYRFGEAQLAKLSGPFLLDKATAGGLNLSTETVGFIYGTVGIIALSFGGILGGILVSKNGLKFWLWPMLVAINLPDIVYVYLSFVLPASKVLVTALIAIEQFGYGFGFTAFMLYLILISDGKFKTSHYALATGFMALGMMLPGMISGFIQELVGYKMFFVWVIISTIPAFIIATKIKIEKDFGKKNN